MAVLQLHLSARLSPVSGPRIHVELRNMLGSDRSVRLDLITVKRNGYEVATCALLLS